MLLPFHYQPRRSGFSSEEVFGHGWARGRERPRVRGRLRASSMLRLEQQVLRTWRREETKLLICASYLVAHRRVYFGIAPNGARLNHLPLYIDRSLPISRHICGIQYTSALWIWRSYTRISYGDFGWKHVQASVTLSRSKYPDNFKGKLVSKFRPTSMHVSQVQFAKN